MSDTVFVTGLALHAYHGVMQHEAKVGQSFLLDLILDPANRQRIMTALQALLISPTQFTPSPPIWVKPSVSRPIHCTM